MRPVPPPAVLPARRYDLAEREVGAARLVYGRGAGPHLLDPLGAAMFDALDGRTPGDEFVEDLAAALEQPVDEATQGFASFLADLRARGLLAGAEPSPEPEPVAGTAHRWRYPWVPPSP